MIERMVLFGASGDLTSRLLLPAVAQLAEDELSARGTLDTAEISADAHLIEEMLQRNPMLFIRSDEADEAWRIIDPVMAAWAAGDVPMQEYAAGTAPRPARSDAFVIAAHGVYSGIGSASRGGRRDFGDVESL